MNDINKRGLNNSGDSILNFIVKNKAMFILLALVMLASIISPRFLGYQNILNILRQISMSAIIGSAFTLILASGDIDLSAGLLVSLLGVIMAMVTKVEGVSFFTGVAIIIVIGAALGAFNAFVISTFNIAPFIATLATGQIFKGVSYLVSNTSTITGVAEEFAVIGQGYLLKIPVPVYIMVAVILVISIVLYRTSFGRHVIAVGGNAEASRVSGINVKKVRYGVFITMGVCAAITSLIITGRAMAAQPAAAEGMELDVIAAVVIGGTALNGGKGTVVGTLFGCIIIGVIDNMLNLAGIHTSWQLVAKGFIILFAMFADSKSEQFFINRAKKLMSK